MITKIVKFKATDGIILDGILQKCEKNTDKILIEVHGMTSNCFKEREKIIANKVKELDYLGTEEYIECFITEDNYLIITNTQDYYIISLNEISYK